MKKIFVLLLVFSAVICAQQKAPKITVDKNEFNFGQVEEGQIVTHDFIVTNKGGESLEIKGVGASCGCTAAKPEKNVVAGGESVKINVKFNSEGRRGPQKKYIYVKSNDPEKAELRLLLTGIVNESAKNK
ncbi:MAG TPA: DUF1573 domain-containing protein [Ignavibacteriales bacterium]|nr:DUF1573 domain-containing protein [Ignavibacteriales bacterium]HEX3072599.1 DUF1573 domain-containing protein [Ignavibacteriales bacterium]